MSKIQPSYRARGDFKGRSPLARFYVRLLDEIKNNLKLLSNFQKPVNSTIGGIPLTQVATISCGSVGAAALAAPLARA
jgi:hypothetical protein